MTRGRTDANLAAALLVAGWLLRGGQSTDRSKSVLSLSNVNDDGHDARLGVAQGRGDDACSARQPPRHG